MCSAGFFNLFREALQRYQRREKGGERLLREGVMVSLLKVKSREDLGIAFFVSKNFYLPLHPHLTELLSQTAAVYSRTPRKKQEK